MRERGQHARRAPKGPVRRGNAGGGSTGGGRVTLHCLTQRCLRPAAEQGARSACLPPHSLPQLHQPPTRRSRGVGHEDEGVAPAGELQVGGGQVEEGGLHLAPAEQQLVLCKQSRIVGIESTINQSINHEVELSGQRG